MQKPPKLTPPTEKEKALAQEIRKRWIDPSQYEDMPVAFAVSQGIAQLIESISRNAPPPEVLNILEVLKYSYLILFGDQYMAVLVQLIGDVKTVKKMMSHKNSRSIVARIFERIGPISPGMTIPSIQITDILEDEGFFP